MNPHYLPELVRLKRFAASYTPTISLLEIEMEVAREAGLFDDESMIESFVPLNPISILLLCAPPRGP